jgi:hypothetical protein
VNLGIIDWIWHVRGSLALAPGQSSDQAFDRLDPLFREYGTSHERIGDTLTFRKKDPAAQDKMSVFDEGVLQIETADEGRVLRYRLTSRILLFCFLAPLLFLGIGQLTIALGKLEKPAAEKADAAKKPEAEKPDVQLNPIDKFLGAPEPEKKPVTKAEKAKAEKEKAEKKAKRYAPTAAYVFAGIFAFLYVAGRILEDRLVKRLFRRKLHGA